MKKERDEFATLGSLVVAATELRNAAEYVINTYGNDIGERDEADVLKTIGDLDFVLDRLSSECKVCGADQ